MFSRTTLPSITAIALAFTLTACAGAGTSGAGASGPSNAAGDDTALGDGHGAIAGVQELPEPQLHLLTLDETGAIAHLDLLDESVDELGTADGVADVTDVATEGRYAYLVRPDAGAVSVVDSGVWTWNHGDHFHYYRGEASVLGDVEGSGRATVAANDAGAGLFFAETGEAIVLDAAMLADGSLDERVRVSVEPHDGFIVPVGSSALVTEPGADGAPASVRIVDGGGRQGEAVECADAAGTIATVVGVVVGCRDGALLATIGDPGVVEIERIPYPADAGAPPATEFRAREGRPTVAAVAGTSGIWLLDTRTRSWALLDAGTPILQASAVDDADEHVLALAADGRVLVLSGATGEVLAETEPIVAASVADPALVAGVELIADQHRAYLNGPAERRLYEIDFADAARIARTFDTAAEPRFTVETGR